MKRALEIVVMLYKTSNILNATELYPEIIVSKLYVYFATVFKSCMPAAKVKALTLK